MADGVLEGADLALWRAFLLWSENIHAEVNRAVTAAAELSVAEFEVMTRLWSHPDGALSQLDLTTRLSWSASRASHLLHRLESRGLISRADTGRGRARSVQLTAAGRESLARAFGVHGSAFRRQLLDRLTDEQRAVLMEIMTKGRQGS